MNKRVVKRRRTVRRKTIKNFGDNLRKERERKGMTREQVALSAFISPQTLQKIEDGYIKNPAVATVVDIANSLKMDERKFARLVGLGQEEMEREEGFSREFAVGRTKRWSSHQ